MGDEDLERFETDAELQIYREYRDVLPMFRYVVETERRSPWLAAATSAVLFLVGAFPSVLPFALTDDTSTALFAAAVLSGIGLLIVGVGKTVMTKTNPVISGVENLLIGLVGGVVSFTIGRIVQGFISS